MENHLTISYEVEYTFIICHSIATPTDLPKRNKNTFTVKLVHEFNGSFIPNVMECYTKLKEQITDSCNNTDVSEKPYAE